MKKEILIIILLLIVSFPAVKSLLKQGGYTSHDLTHHVIRQISMDKLLSEAQFPPRWSGDLNNGYGYPVFLFNYPLPAMAGEIFHKAGLGYVDSVKAVLFSSMILSVLGMYLFLRSYLGNSPAAFLGAVFYLYAPLRFLNIYVSAAVGSALALGILPFIFWSMVVISKGNKGNWGVVVGALSLAGLILAHNVTALIFVPVILVFAWILIRGVRDFGVIRELSIMFLLGLGLSAWFFLPALWEKQYIVFDQIYSGFYKDQFINLWQLVRSPWGYGLSHPQKPELGDMSYQLGLAQILVMLVLVPLVWTRREIREIRVIGGLVLGLFALSIFLMLKASLPLWESLTFLSLVQFPLRFQAVAIFSASVAAALLVKYLPLIRLSSLPASPAFGVASPKSPLANLDIAGLQRGERKQGSINNDRLLDSRLRGNDVTRWFIFIPLLVLAIFANRNHWNINEKFDPEEQYYLNLKTTSTSYGEHLPKWGRVMDKSPSAKLEIIKGIGKVRVVSDKSVQVIAEVEAAAPAKLRLNQFYFPGWEIAVDGKQIRFDYLIDGGSYGLPVFDIETGTHIIKAEFKKTLVRNLADTISIVTVIIALAITSRRFL